MSKNLLLLSKQLYLTWSLCQKYGQIREKTKKHWKNLYKFHYWYCILLLIKLATISIRVISLKWKLFFRLIRIYCQARIFGYFIKKEVILPFIAILKKVNFPSIKNLLYHLLNILDVVWSGFKYFKYLKHNVYDFYSSIF